MTFRPTTGRPPSPELLLHGLGGHWLHVEPRGFAKTGGDAPAIEHRLRGELAPTLNGMTAARTPGPSS